jgi:hypothetical protein
MRSSAWGLAGILLVCVLAGALRSVPAAESPHLFGFDPYVHYYFAGYAVGHGRVAPVDGFQGGLEDDRAYWPGLHVLAGGTEVVTGAHRLDVFKSLPQFLGTLTVLLVFLVARRMFGTAPALVAAMLYAVADHSVFQSSWLVQETLGIALLVAFLFVLTQLDPARRWEGAVLLVLVYAASLASHHFSHAILLATFLLAALVAPRRDDRNRLLGMFLLLLPLTLVWWIGFGGRTGSFPDIAHRALVVVGSPLGVALVWAAVAALAVDHWQGWRFGRLRGLAKDRSRRWAQWLDADRGRLSVFGILVLLLTAATLMAYERWFSPLPGLGTQQATKYVLAALGAVGAATLVARGDPAARLLLGLFALLAVGLALVMFVFTFLPLQLRFFDYVYIPLAILSGTGITRLSRPSDAAIADGHGRWARTQAGTRRTHAALPAVLASLVVGMAVAAMSVDDVGRATGRLTDRYYHSDAEFEAARWIRDNTEPNAYICAPFGIQPVVYTFGERSTDIVVIARCIEGGGWESAVHEIQMFGLHGPTYIYLTTDTTKYGENELQTYGQEYVFHVGGTFLRYPVLFEFKYHNDETIILKVNPEEIR